MAEGTGMSPVSARIDDLKRMQRRMAQLHEQNDSGDESQQDLPGYATYPSSPGDQATSIRDGARRHRASHCRADRDDGSDVCVMPGIRCSPAVPLFERCACAFTDHLTHEGRNICVMGRQVKCLGSHPRVRAHLPDQCSESFLRAHVHGQAVPDLRTNINLRGCVKARSGACGRTRPRPASDRSNQ